jgi:trans-aconitate methyltransferase
VKGTGLRPVLTALADDPQAREAFVAEYRAALRQAYPAGVTQVLGGVPGGGGHEASSS